MTVATDAMTLTGRLADGNRTGYREVCPIERARTPSELAQP